MRTFLVAGLLALFMSSELRADPLDAPQMELAPYGWTGGDGKPRGLFIDVMEEISAESGIAVNPSTLPVGRLIKALVNGRTGCAIMLRSAWGETQFAQVALVYDDFRTVAIARPDRPVLRHIDDMRGLRVGIPRGTYFGIAFIDEAKAYHPVHTDDYNQATVLFRSGRVDAIVGTALSLYHNLESIGMDPTALAAPLVLAERPVWLQCEKSLDGGTIERLRRAADRLREAGRFEALRANYTK